MSLATDVQDQIRRYVGGSVSADDLSEWIDVRAQQIHDAGDIDLRQLTDLTLSLLEDVFHGYQSDKRARATLAELVGMVVSFSGRVTSSEETVAVESTDPARAPKGTRA